MPKNSNKALFPKFIIRKITEFDWIDQLISIILKKNLQSAVMCEGAKDNRNVSGPCKMAFVIPSSLYHGIPRELCLMLLVTMYIRNQLYLCRASVASRCPKSLSSGLIRSLLTQSSTSVTPSDKSHVTSCEPPFILRYFAFVARIRIFLLRFIVPTSNIA